MSQTMTEFEAAIQPALEAYSAARDEHGHDYDTGHGTPAACKCGWTPKRLGRFPRRQVGLHISAAEKRAEKAYDVATLAIITERSTARRRGTA